MLAKSHITVPALNLAWFFGGALKDGDILPDTIDIPKGKKALVVTLIGSTDAFVEKPPEERPLFVEDMTPAELKKTAQRFRNENNGRKVEHDVDVVAIQREQGGDRDRDGGKKEMYQYNRFVTGLPQHQIEDKLIERKTRGVHILFITRILQLRLRLRFPCVVRLPF